MYNYKELGLVNTKEMFEKAYYGGYTVPAFNFISIEQMNAIIDAVIETKSPVILLASPNLHRQLGHEMTARVVQAGVDRIKNAGLELPVVLHLDHGMSFEHCVTAVENGFSSIMIDGSALPFEENIALTKKTVEYAHAHDVTVEAELGILSGAEEDGAEGHRESMYTDPGMAEEFIQRSGADSLAISIGTCHGLVKMKPNPDGTLPELRFDILKHIQKNVPGFPIVLHGASNISPEYVKMINQHGGHIEQTVGIPDDQIRKAAKTAVCKVNIATDGWICALANTRRILDENPAAIDSRVFTLKTRPEMKELYLHKIDIMGSAGKA
ncbi:MAG: ketose-bisphosphate aldolase [Lachnospiraceae bacterium]|nr:ketose-bisphosphate aldolase [Lachnospiraceae bacterium]